MYDLGFDCLWVLAPPAPSMLYFERFALRPVGPTLKGGRRESTMVGCHDNRGDAIEGLHYCLEIDIVQLILARVVGKIQSICSRTLGCGSFINASHGF